MSTDPGRPRLLPIVWCVEEVHELFERYRDTPPDPTITARLRELLAHGARIGAVAGIPGGTCRPNPLPDKEIEP